MITAKQLQLFKKGKDMELKDTIEMMTSDNYKERFKAEYYQIKIRYEKLKDLNTRKEAADRTMGSAVEFPMPVCVCPYDVLIEQQSIMEHYLHILEVRAKIEGITL